MPERAGRLSSQRAGRGITLAALLAMAAVAVITAACGAGSPPADQGIEGRYVITGPGFIVDCSEVPPGEERDACEEANNPWTQPVAAADIEVQDLQSRMVAQVVTDSEGAFRVPLPQGQYMVCGPVCDGPITVTAGQFTFHEFSLAVP